MGHVVPLLIFVGITYIAPLVMMLMRTIHDPVAADSLLETLALPREWDGEGMHLEAADEARSAS